MSFISSVRCSWVDVSFFHQKFCMWSIPGAFQLCVFWMAVSKSSFVTTWSMCSSRSCCSFSSWLIHCASSLWFLGCDHIWDQKVFISSAVGGTTLISWYLGFDKMLFRCFGRAYFDFFFRWMFCIFEVGLSIKIVLFKRVQSVFKGIYIFIC
jgi:hypothetical protein